VKNTTRTEFRVRIQVKVSTLASLGLGSVDTGDGTRRLAGRIVSPSTVDVEIAPQRLGDFGGMISTSDRLASRDIEGDYERRCKDLLADLKSLPQVAGGEVTWTEEHTCSHCGYSWEVITEEYMAAGQHIEPDDEIGLPVCCEKAQNEFRAEKTATTEETQPA
jgi:hypothetical protein